MFHLIDGFIIDKLGDGFIGNMLIALITLVFIFVIAFAFYVVATILLKTLKTKSKSNSLRKIASFAMTYKMNSQIFVLACFFMLTTYADRFTSLNKLISTIALYGTIITLMLIIGKIIDIISDFYATKAIAKKRPIKGPLTIVKVLIYSVFGIVMLAALINQSPIVLISGIGTFTAILSIVFKDALLGLVAGIQITSENLLQIGDWISIPSIGVEGSVTDIALISVKVTAFDNTSITVPAYTFLSTPFKNWHNTLKNKQRQVSFSINIDPDSVKQEENGTNLTRFRKDLLTKIKSDEHTDKTLSIVCKSKGTNGTAGIPVEIMFTTDIVDFIEFTDYVSEFSEDTVATLNEYGLKVLKAVIPA